jgi:hypothetical protein
MRTGIFITLQAKDRRRLEAIVRDRNAPQKHVWRAEIVLLKAEGLGTVEIMRRTGKSKTCVWRWQERFMQESGEGLLRLRNAPRIVPQPARTPKNASIMSRNRLLGVTSTRTRASPSVEFQQYHSFGLGLSRRMLVNSPPHRLDIDQYQTRSARANLML